MRDRCIFLFAFLASLATSGSAFAADVPIKTPPAAVVASTWTGFYAGVNVGWSWGKTDTKANAVVQEEPQFASSIHDTTHPDGLIGGVQIGYNWQGASNWVLGVEADIQASGESARGRGQGTLINFVIPDFLSFNFIDALEHKDAIQWFGTVRGRVGYVFWPSTMFYATGGFAYGRVASSFSNIISGTICVSSTCFAFPDVSSSNFSGTSIRTGWTAGAGFEGFAQDRRVTWKVEYLYVDLGTAHYSWVDPIGLAITASSKFSDHIFRVGLNLHFD